MNLMPANSLALCLLKKSQVARAPTSALLVMKGSSNTSVLGKRPGVYPGSVMTTSSTPSLSRSISWAGVPPPLMAGNTWHLMRLLLSAATLLHQGAITFTEAMAVGVQMW